MRKFSKVPLLGFTFLAIASQAHADVAFHGYGQVVMGTVFSNNRTFPVQSEGFNYHADPTFTPNSNFALQASAPLSEGITATTQILAKGDDDFQPKFHWAYLKYQFNDTFALKTGRLQLPFYQFSDYQFVGEAYPWVVPPEAVYYTQASYYDGLNLSAEQSWNDWYFYMQAIYGSFDETTTDLVQTASGSTIPVSIYVREHNLFGAALDSTYNDWLTVRFGTFASKISIYGDGNPANPFTQLQAFVDGLAQQGAPDAAKALDTSNDTTLFYTGSVQITRANWVFIAEYNGQKWIAGANGTSPDYFTQYASLGYHFGKLMPLITFGHRNQWASSAKIKSSIPPNLASLDDPFIGALVSNPGFRLKDYFYDATLRYDLTTTVALKLDYTFYQSHYKTSDYSELSLLSALGQTFTNPQDCNRLLAAVTFSF